MTADEDELLLREAEKIVVAIGRMFPGLCEAVLHDLRRPGQAIHAIESNLSGHIVGDTDTGLGPTRVQDPGFPDVIQNYASRLPDGRPAKSTSIGIRNRSRTKGWRWIRPISRGTRRTCSAAACRWINRRGAERRG